MITFEGGLYLMFCFVESPIARLRGVEAVHSSMSLSPLNEPNGQPPISRLPVPDIVAQPMIPPLQNPNHLHYAMAPVVDHRRVQMTMPQMTFPRPLIGVPAAFMMPLPPVLNTNVIGLGTVPNGYGAVHGQLQGGNASGILSIEMNHFSFYILSRSLFA